MVLRAIESVGLFQVIVHAVFGKVVHTVEVESEPSSLALLLVAVLLLDCYNSASVTIPCTSQTLPTASVPRLTALICLWFSTSSLGMSRPHP